MNFRNLKIVKKYKRFVKRFIPAGNDLPDKMVKGGFWIFSLRIVDRLFHLIKIVVLARLLSPGDFGIFGIALLVLSMFGTFSETGFQVALIQKKGKIESYLNTAWTFGLIRGLLIAAAVFLLAGPAAVFFAAPAAGQILRVIGISVFLNSLNNIAVLYIQKELEFQKFFKYQFLGTIADVAVTITAAFLLKSVWALVLGLIAGNLVRCIMSYVIMPYRPKIQFNREQAKELFGFGKWILSSSILVFLITHGDDIFVGKLLGAVMLGYYQMAYKISNMQTTEITNVISKVSFPAYSKLQDNLPGLKDTYLRVLKLITFMSFPLAGLIFILGPEFTLLFLGEKWMPAVPAMKILVFAGLVRSFVASTGSVFRAIGKPNIETAWQMIRLLIIVILIYPFTIKYGIMGTSVVILLSVFISGIGFGFAILRETKCGIGNFSKIILLPLITGTIMVAAIYAAKLYINSELFGWFFALAGMGILIFLGINYLFDRYLNYGIFPAIKKVFDSFRS